MIIKGSLKRMKKVNVVVEGVDNQKFNNGEKSRRIKVYDANPEQVFLVVQRALEQAQE